MRKAMKKECAAIHVRFHEPVSKRKRILTLAIEIIELIKKYEHLKILREQKKEALGKFRNMISSVNRQFKMLKMEELPIGERIVAEYLHEGLDEGKLRKLPAAPKPTFDKKRIRIKEPKPTEIEKLDLDIDNLRRKIESL